MARKKEYKVKKKRNIPFHMLRGFLKIVIRRPKVVSVNGTELKDKAIYVMNHSGARGPLIFELYFPKRATPWGAHEMCGNYRERWNYLYHVFYRQKLHYGKFRAFTIATLFGIISKWLYGSTGLIGTYHDTRLISTVRNSEAVLNENLSVVIFPEDSTGGYLDMPIAFNRGFIMLAKHHYKRTGEDLPVFSVYYSRQKNRFIVDEPMYINKLLEEGNTDAEIAGMFLESCHNMFETYIKDGPKVIKVNEPVKKVKA